MLQSNEIKLKYNSMLVYMYMLKDDKEVNNVKCVWCVSEVFK